MIYLNEILEINRPIVFLCGPYFNSKNNSDRRGILREFLNDYKRKKVLPLIIDDFLIEDNIKDDSINIQLLEEIFAAISSKTYIFLDTVSTAAELGLFANNSFSNNVTVFLPEKSDILEKSKVGYFVNRIMLKENNNKNISTLTYRPKIVRHPIASDYVVEYYGFTNNKLPKNIEKYIKNDRDLEICKLNLKFENKNIFPHRMNVINYTYRGNKINFNIAIKLLFYISVALTSTDSKYGENENTLLVKIKKVLKDTYYVINKTNRQITEVDIKTRLNQNVDIILKHIIKFIKLYDRYKYKNLRLIKNHKEVLTQNNVYNLFGLNVDDLDLLKRVYNEPDIYYKEFIINTGRKKRKIVKYTDTQNGDLIRGLHRKIYEVLISKYSYSDYSYAYRKGLSIKDCVLIHKDSNSFIKYDIKNFFPTIKISKLVEKIAKIYKIEDKKSLREILSCCFYDDKLPLGFISSPLLSDIYMNDFDLLISEKIKELELDIKFTRYADDILFSSINYLNHDKKQEIDSYMIEVLNKINLTINKAKTKCKFLENTGDHFKFLGINIVKTEEENVITVGRKYINDISKLYLEYLSAKDNNQKTINRFYKEKELVGKVGFVKQIEGEEGYNKIICRLNKCTKGQITHCELFENDNDNNKYISGA